MLADQTAATLEEISLGSRRVEPMGDVVSRLGPTICTSSRVIKDFWPRFSRPIVNCNFLVFYENDFIGAFVHKQDV